MKRARIAILALIAAGAPAAAEAHLVTSGMGSVYDGISHFGLSPEDFLPVIALAFFAGLKGPRTARTMLFALASAWLLGGVLSMAGANPPLIILSAATAILFLLTGGLLAANAGCPLAVTTLVAAALGLVRGLADLAGVTATLAHLLVLCGMAASAFAVFALAASLTLPITKASAIIAARVSGSWVAAVGLLFAGWLLRYGDRVQ